MDKRTPDNLTHLSAAERGPDDAPARNPHSCGNSCRFGSPGGMATNSTCSCLEGIGAHRRVNTNKGIAWLRGELKRVTTERDEIHADREKMWRVMAGKDRVLAMQRDNVRALEASLHRARELLLDVSKSAYDHDDGSGVWVNVQMDRTLLESILEGVGRQRR